MLVADHNRSKCLFAMKFAWFRKLKFIFTNDTPVALTTSAIVPIHVYGIFRQLYFALSTSHHERLGKKCLVTVHPVSFDLQEYS